MHRTDNLKPTRQVSSVLHTFIHQLLQLLALYTDGTYCIVKLVFKSACQSSWEAIWAIRWVFLVSTMNTANYWIRGRSLHTVLMKKRCNPEPQEQTLGRCTEAFSWCSTEPAQEAALDATHLPGCKAGRQKRIDKISMCSSKTQNIFIFSGSH